MDDDEKWQNLKTSWAQYKLIIESWVSAADASRDDEELDALIHEVIHSHNHWANLLGEVIEAKHHH